jgi:hypothetical protein
MALISAFKMGVEFQKNRDSKETRGTGRHSNR